MAYAINNLFIVERPDLSRHVLHFTGRTGQRTAVAQAAITNTSDEERLIRILREHQINAYPMFQTPDPVVCFTESTRLAINEEIEGGRYSPLAIGFAKDVVFQSGGGPAFYLRGDSFELVEELPPQIRAFCTRYWPGVTHDEQDQFATADSFIDTRSEWIREREWRVLGVGDPPVFHFEQPAFILLPDEAAIDRVVQSGVAQGFGAGYAGTPILRYGSEATAANPDHIWPA